MGRHKIEQLTKKFVHQIIALSSGIFQYHGDKVRRQLGPPAIRHNGEAEPMLAGQAHRGNIDQHMDKAVLHLLNSAHPHWGTGDRQGLWGAKWWLTGLGLSLADWLEKLICSNPPLMVHP